MLSRIEKQEMLKDAGNEKRREAFRQILVQQTSLSFDAYLKFLEGVHKTFSQITLPIKRVSGEKFKL